MTRLTDLRCACGSAEWIAAEPGNEPERAADPLTVDRGAPLRAWCAA